VRNIPAEPSRLDVSVYDPEKRSRICFLTVDARALDTHIRNNGATRSLHPPMSSEGRDGAYDPLGDEAPDCVG